MRHKYVTPAIVLARSPRGEATTTLTLLTRELGLVRARAQSLRRSGARLAPALTTLAESEIMLVRGQEEWRVAGAVLEVGYARTLPHGARERAARISALVLRLSGHDARDTALFELLKHYLAGLTSLREELHDAAEVAAALRILSILGLDAESFVFEAFTPQALAQVERSRSALVARINHGIAASGL